MDLANKQVKHQTFGVGNVAECSDVYIKVDFPSGNKEFIFPDAFEKYLTLTNEKAAKMVRTKLQKRAAEKTKYRKIILSQRAEKLRAIKYEKLPGRGGFGKIHPCSQSVFWCKSQEIDSIFERWDIYTGTIKSGHNKNQSRKLARVDRNTACLLTTRKHDEPEKDRRIIGMFMVENDFDPSLCKDGYIPAHMKHRIRLTLEESQKMLFWNYYQNKKYPVSMTWRSGRHRYFDNMLMAQILQDTVTLKQGSEEDDSARKFLDYFCEMNKINKNEIPTPAGALKSCPRHA